MDFEIFCFDCMKVGQNYTQPLGCKRILIHVKNFWKCVEDEDGLKTSWTSTEFKDGESSLDGDEVEKEVVVQVECEGNVWIEMDTELIKNATSPIEADAEMGD